MVEILTSIEDTRRILVYVTVDEQTLIKRLDRIKDPSGIYCKNGVLTGYHWVFKPETVRKLKLTAK